MQTFLEITAEKTGVNFTDCNKLRYPEKVYLKLLSREIDSVSDIKTEFNQAVTNCKKEESSNDKGGSGGGSGSSGGGRGGASSSSAYFPDNVQAVPAEFIDLAGFEWAKDDI